MTEEKFIAIIGDINDSKLLENREEIQNHFIQNLNLLNKKYEKYMASYFTISMGDSVQGLLYAEAPVTTIIREIELSMLPTEFKFGIGIGSIHTQLNRKNSQLNDGPAYHNARQALEIVEEKNHKHASSKIDTYLVIEQSEMHKVLLINTIFSLNTELKSRWTARQKEIIKAYFDNNENQYETAKALEIGQSSVSKALKSAGFYAYISSQKNVESYLLNYLVGERNDL